MYISYTYQRNIFFGQHFYTWFDLGTGLHKIVIQQIGTTLKPIMKFYKKESATGSEAFIGKIETNGTNTFYRDTSDKRAKENIKPIENHYDILDQLNPCNFKFKDSENPPQDGFIADEVYKIYPICTSGKPGDINEDGSPDFMMIDTKPLIPILTKCVQGNRQEIKELKLENDELKNKVDDLELKLNELGNKLMVVYEKLSQENLPLNLIG